MVGLGRLELPTSRLSGVRSNQLSYRPGACPSQKSSGGRIRCPQLPHGPFGPAGGEQPQYRKQRFGSAGGAWTKEGIRRRRRGRYPGTPELGEPAELGKPNAGILRKEVIQPQVPLRLPCYDFTPVADLTVVGCLPFGLANRLRVKPTPMV